MRKIKITAYALAVLWIAVFTQVIVGRLFQDDKRMIEAFAGIDSDIMESNIEINVDYGDKFLTIDDKKSLLKYLSNAVGVTDGDISEEKKEADSTGIKLVKKSPNGEIIFEIVSENIENQIEHHYLVLNLTTYSNKSEIIKYKKSLENAVNNIKAASYQSVLKFNGIYQGKLTLSERNKIADKLLNELQVEVISEERTDDLYTIYGYTGLIPNYIKAGKNKVNINIVMYYDKEEDKTNLYLASPILNE